MPWKDRYTISDEKSLAGLRGDAGRTGSAAASASSSTSPRPAGPRASRPQDLTTPDAYFGMHGGLAALGDVLRRYGLKATFAVPAVMAEIHADTIRALRRRGARDRRARLQARGCEPAQPRRGARATAAHDGDPGQGRGASVLQAGSRCRGPSDQFAGGTVSGNTVDLLIEAGYDYFGNGLADDVPHYWVTISPAAAPS